MLKIKNLQKSLMLIFLNDMTTLKKMIQPHKCQEFKVHHNMPVNILIEK